MNAATATTVNVQEAKTRLSELLKRAEAGEEIVIARAGKPIASLRLVEDPKPQFGTLAGLGGIGDAFFEPLPEDELRRWEDGGPEDPLNQ